MAIMTAKVDITGLPETRAYVRALEILIGMMGTGYPQNLMERFINECVDLKQDNLLTASRIEGENQIMKVIGSETFTKLVGYLTEQVKQDLEIEEAERLAESIPVPATVETEKEKRPVPELEKTSKVPEVKKTGSAKARKKATGAADGK